jgi:hypothetical protein
MSVYDRRQQLRQRETDEDPLLAIMYGTADVDMDKIAAHVSTYNLTDTERATLERVRKDHRAEPRLFMQMFAMWLAPQLGLAEGALPRRFEPFQQALGSMCMDMLEGRIVSLQKFVHHAVGEYVMGPRDTS